MGNTWGKDALKIVLATSNKGKVAEFQNLLAPLNWEIILQSNVGVSEIEENGLTFIENALLKARNAAKYSNLPALADDSGLMVDALKGEPGIYSSRYAGKNATDKQNISKLLNELAVTPELERTARFYCVLVYLRYAEDPAPIIAQGIWEGRILQASRGDKGFGYDPIFFDPVNNCSAAELTPAEKNKSSHRGRASQDLIRQLSNYSEF